MRWIHTGLSVWLSLVTFIFAIRPATAQTAVHGSFAVTDGGGAQYSIEIPAPPGVTGLQPHLSLVYSSGGGYGLLGMGWSLAGLSSVSRCPRTWAQDGLTATGAAPVGIHFDNNDRLCLDGQRLIQVSATSSQGGTEFRTEIDNLSRIIAFGANPANPDYIQVESKSGLISQYGNTTDSRVEINSGSTTWRQWAVNSVRDRFGHQITVKYTKNMAIGQFQPLRINYTWPSDGVSTGASVNFSYVTIPAPTLSYVWGSLIDNNSLISEIDTVLNTSSGGTQAVTQYKLYYLSQPQPMASSLNIYTLAEIQVCAGASPDCSTMPPVYFNYVTGTTDGAAAGDFQIKHTGNEIFATDQIFPGDYFGDGVDGMLVVASSQCALGTASWCWNGWKLFRNTSSGMVLVSSSTANLGYGPGDSITVIDYLGTGRPGLFVMSASGQDQDGNQLPNPYWFYAPNTSGSPGLTLVAQGLTGPFPVVNNVYAGDFLGTGQMTLLVTTYYGWEMLAYSAAANGIQVIGSSAAVAGPNPTADISNTLNGPSAQDRVYVATFAGDGASQVLTVCDPCNFGPAVYNADGNLVPSVSPPASTGTPYSGWRLYSFDGANMNLVNSNYFTNGPDRYTDVYPGNFGGDGKASLFVVPHYVNGVNQAGWNGWALLRSTGNGFTQPIVGSGLAGGERFFVGDFNGDGRDGVISLGDSTNQVTAKQSTCTIPGFSGSFPCTVNTPSPDVGWTLWQSDGQKMNNVASGSSPSNTETITVGSFFQHAGAGIAVTTPTSPNSGWKLYDTNWVQPRFLMTQTSNGQTTTNISYAPLNSPGVHAPASGDVYPVNDINPSIPVVRSFTVDDGLGGVLNNVYTYVGLKADRTGRGLLGFSVMGANQLDSNLATTKVFAQNFPYTGFLLVEYGWSAQTNPYQLLSEISNNPGCQDFVTPNMGCSVAIGHRYFVYKQSSIIQRLDLNRAAYPNQMVVSTFGDGWGNETQTVTTTADGYSDTVNRTFSNDTANWLLGRQTQSTDTRVSP